MSSRNAFLSGEGQLLDAVLRSDRFRLEREADWQELERIVSALEKGQRRKLSADDLSALPTLYRTAASSLSIARESSLDRSAIDYLESLTLRAYLMIYGTRTSFWRWLGDFLGGGWSRAVRAMAFDMLAAFLIMAGAALVGWLLVDSDPAWFHRLVPAEMAQGRDPDASVETLRSTIFGNQDQQGKGAFAAMLFSNNAQVSILAFALGFCFGVPTILLLIHNMVLLGAMLHVFASKGLGVDFAAWLSIHGTTELLAILLAGGAGIHIGRVMAFPGQRAVMDMAAEAGRRAAFVMAGVVLMMMVAGVLEAYFRQIINDTPTRFLIGGIMLTFWALYLGLAGRWRVAEARP